MDLPDNRIEGFAATKPNSISFKTTCVTILGIIGLPWFQLIDVFTSVAAPPAAVALLLQALNTICRFTFDSWTGVVLGARMVGAVST
jgi:hypothetical protein